MVRANEARTAPVPRLTVGPTGHLKSQENVARCGAGRRESPGALRGLLV